MQKKSQRGIKAITKPWKTTMKKYRTTNQTQRYVCLSMYEGFWPPRACLSVGLYAISHKNYLTDFHETWMGGGSRPRIDPVNLWCWAMNLFSLSLRLFLLFSNIFIHFLVVNALILMLDNIYEWGSFNFLYFPSKQVPFQYAVFDIRLDRWIKGDCWPRYALYWVPFLFHNTVNVATCLRDLYNP